MAASKLKSFDAYMEVPTILETVIIAEGAALGWIDRHDIEELEVHEEVGHVIFPPIDTLGEELVNPKFSPKIVMLAAPVDI